MKDKDLLDVLTVTGWAMWLRYIKQNNIKKDANGDWPEYDVNGFMMVLDINEDDVAVVDEAVHQLDLPSGTQDTTVHGLKPPTEG